MHALGIVLADATYDFSGVTGALPGLASAVVTAGGLVLAAGLSVAGVIWGFPKLIGLFKKTAK
ncbi:hypothetical protein [Microbacterium sp. 4NA327F11]|uniref:hypothetical protein n=1 Tax=Microbacterium sp. 4NA327F11 TaxID=2502229 RepID=UPI0010F4DACB|nr:hypothetical protein [Microbacterium sp. 4NA327F11]